MSNHFDRATILYNQGRYQLAEQEIRQELALAPHHAGAHAILGLCLAHQQQYLAALIEAKSAIHLAPDVPYFHHALADVYRWQGQLASAYISIS
jgi:tetratricopeptide (TPR) repeat protein